LSHHQSPTTVSENPSLLTSQDQRLEPYPRSPPDSPVQRISVISGVSGVSSAARAGLAMSELATIPRAAMTPTRGSSHLLLGSV